MRRSRVDNFLLIFSASGCDRCCVDNSHRSDLLQLPLRSGLFSKMLRGMLLFKQHQPLFKFDKPAPFNEVSSDHPNKI